ALTGRPLTWEQVQRVGEVRIEDPTWKGGLLRVPIRVIRHDDSVPIALLFRGEGSDNLIYITASRDLSENPPADVYEALVEIPKPRMPEYFVVYTNPRGGFDRLRA